jgi:uncharacterized membrane protein (DUF373 family)
MTVFTDGNDSTNRLDRVNRRGPTVALARPPRAGTKTEADLVSDLNVAARRSGGGHAVWIADAIRMAERGVYFAIGVMLILALAFALAGTGKSLWDGLWSSANTTVDVTDRLLFMLVLVEILLTVHASIRTGALVCEPFLIVGLIGCIRRILMIALAASQITELGRWTDGNRSLFHASMLESGVLALLIVVLVGSIWILRTTSQRADASREDSVLRQT